MNFNRTWYFYHEINESCYTYRHKHREKDRERERKKERGRLKETETHMYEYYLYTYYLIFSNKTYFYHATHIKYNLQ